MAAEIKPVTARGDKFNNNSKKIELLSKLEGYVWGFWKKIDKNLPKSQNN